MSVCFSWALGPNSSYFNFSLVVVTVWLYNTIVVAQTAKKKWDAGISLLIIIAKSQSEHLMLC